jgi:two-component system nitrogen regulation response regulator GlnG
MVASKDISKEDLPDEFFEVESTSSAEFEDWEQALADYAIKQLENGTQRLLDVTTPIYENIMIKAALKMSNGKKKEAADLLGMGRNTLTRKIADLDI